MLLSNCNISDYGKILAYDKLFLRHMMNTSNIQKFFKEYTIAQSSANLCKRLKELPFVYLRLYGQSYLYRTSDLNAWANSIAKTIGNTRYET